MTYELRFLESFALTVAVETAVLWAALRLLPGAVPAPSSGRILGAGMLCSSATLPWLWFVLPAFVASRGLYLGIGESAVALAETAILAAMLPAAWPRALALSLACNGISWGIGSLAL